MLTWSSSLAIAEAIGTYLALRRRLMELRDACLFTAIDAAADSQVSACMRLLRCPLRIFARQRAALEATAGSLSSWHARFALHGFLVQCRVWAQRLLMVLTRSIKRLMLRPERLLDE